MTQRKGYRGDGRGDNEREAELRHGKFRNTYDLPNSVFVRALSNPPQAIVCVQMVKEDAIAGYRTPPAGHAEADPGGCAVVSRCKREMVPPWRSCTQRCIVQYTTAVTRPEAQWLPIVANEFPSLPSGHLAGCRTAAFRAVISVPNPESNEEFAVPARASTLAFGVHGLVEGRDPFQPTHARQVLESGFSSQS